MIKKPMLADNKSWNPELVESNLPLMVFLKLDGIRMLVHDGVGYSRSLKPLPNKSLQAKVAEFADELEGFDGEVIVGDFTDEYCFKNSHRACMKADLEADHRFICFDLWNTDPEMVFKDRLEALNYAAMRSGCPMVETLDYEVFHNMYDLNKFLDLVILSGHEGAILRRPDGLYKNGRATSKSGWMYKYKSRVDTEITVTEFHELMINNNPKTTNEIGRSQRSSHKAGKIPGGTLGSVEGYGTFDDGTPFTTKIGVFSGFTKEDLQNIWDNKDKFIGSKMKIKYMGIGSDKSPRTPVALGFRNKIDL